MTQGPNLLGKDIPTTPLRNNDESEPGRQRRRADEIIEQVNTLKRHYGDARQEREDKWLEAWAQYFGTPEAQNYLRARTHHTVGDVQNDWRHRVPTGKAFEMVESVVSFLMGATFPNENWFDVEAVEHLNFQEEDYRKYLRLIRTFTQRKLEDANFQDYFENFLRQAVTLGTSVLAMPWRYRREEFPLNVRDAQGNTVQKTEERVTQNTFQFEVVDMFDFFIDPTAKMPNEGNIIRRMTKTRGELIRLVQDGTYPEATVKQIQELPAVENVHDPDDESHKQEKEEFTGMNPHHHQLHSPGDIIEVLEFWGNLTVENEEYQDVVATVAGDALLSFDSNPFWGGKPFVVGTYIPVVNSPYGLGVLDPVLGDLHARTLTRNQRLDITEFTINPMFEVVNDGTLDLSQLYSEPGRVIPVTEAGSINQINTITDVSTSVQEEQLMEQSIEKSTGTGAFIGSGATRNAERVTAQEIEATRAAGGNRLNGVHRHIERQALFTILQKCFRQIQQFVTEDETIPLPNEEDPDVVEFLQVGPPELNTSLQLKPRGADFIADEEFELRQRIDFINTAAQVPQMAQQLNWKEVAKDLARRFLRDDWEKYVKGAGEQEEDQQNEQQLPVDEVQQGPESQAASEIEQIREAARSVSGQPGAQAVEESLRSGQAEEALRNIGEQLQSRREEK